MRLPCIAAFLLLGCGDDMGVPLDGGHRDAPVDGAEPDAPPLDRTKCTSSLTPSFIADSLVVPPPNVGFDLNGDGIVDNLLGNLRNAGLNDALRTQTHNPPYLIITVENLVDPQNDPSVQAVIYQGVDADGDPTNDFSGMGEFWFTLNSVDANCRPLAILPAGALVNGHFEAEADHALVPLNFAVFDIRRAHVTGDIAPDLSSLSNVLVGGAATPCKLSQTHQTITDQSVLDLLTGVYGQQPDIDLDGDGLEMFVASPSAGVYACIDANGTRIDGASCACDPRIADGFSLALEVSAVKAILLGPVPPPDGGL